MPDPQVALRGAFVAATLLYGTLAFANEPKDLVRVMAPDQTTVYRLLATGLDVYDVHDHAPDAGELDGKAVDFLLTEDQQELLMRAGFPPQVLQKDLQAFYADRLASSPPAFLGGGPPNFGLGGMGGYYTFAEYENLLDHYSSTYPNLVSAKQNLGTSHEGRTIWGVRVSDNPGIAENEPRILFDSLHHAREPMSGMTAMWILEHLVNGYGVDPQITQLVDSREIWFVPVVNPDGYVYNQAIASGGGGLWRKNRRNNPGSCDGVDLNRNYATAWGYDNIGSAGSTCDDLYRGPSPLSEPETQAIDQLHTAQGFAVAWSMHCHGDLLLAPYGYIDQLADPVYPEYGADMAAFNGYESILGFVLYPANGTAIDHYHAAHGAVAYTPEIGNDFWPPISDAVETAQENLDPALLMIRYAGSWVVLLDVDVTEVIGDGDGDPDPGETLDLRFDLRNKGQDAASSILATLTSSSPALSLVGSNTKSLPGGLASLSNTQTPTFRVQLDSSAALGAPLPLSLELSFDGLVNPTSTALVPGTARVVARDDFETDRGWIAGLPGDGASTGIWERDDPIQITQSGSITQPASDTTAAPGTECYVTGNNGTNAGDDDIDDGETTLLTPRFDLSQSQGPRVSYQRHYYCSTGEDPFKVDISNDDGQSWVNVETVIGTENVWTRKEWRVAEFVPPTDAMRLRFVAIDDPNNSVTEALIDDFEVVDYGAAPYLGTFGPATVGGQVSFQQAQPPSSTYVLFVSLGQGSAVVGGIDGTFGLDPAGFVALFTATGSTSGLTELNLPVPDDGTLAGVTAFFQSAVVAAPTPAWSTVAKVTIE